MTVTTEQLEWAAIAVLFAWSFASSFWFARQRGKDFGVLIGQTQKIAKDDSDRHMDSLGAVSELNERFRTHSHEGHTHELVKASEHQENGAKVVIKKCLHCDAVFRDRQE